ncbi:uncharacterized protein TRAVEDRAFT_161872 [Trametes versicolor FP-101664 SS1]|uniref:uncharacterized protein n=1 Tax=Trametes versicolor (strain FP-101664) TaxID=717944 RepID=UPI000462235A|nr:uncharacterized protein TRAVEDRAFT_161872 [Trametes versicolor FP-101664 SS1]EIW63539.1 hypothetical protein TRAVEDRAFT_161872 [Trametes versicolor FP-101664 SS1]
MATAVQLPAPDAGAPHNDVSFGPVPPNGHSHSKSQSNSYSQRLTLTEFDLSDDRYPSLSSRKSQSPSSPPVHSPTGGFDPAFDAGMTAALRASYEKSHSSDPVPLSKAWIGENITQEPAEEWNAPPATPREAQSPRPEDTTYPSTSPSPLVETYSFDRPAARPSRDGSGEQRLPYNIPLPQSPLPQLSDMGQPLSSPRAFGDRYDSPAPSSPRHAALVSPGGGTMFSQPMSPIVPLSAGPTYNAVTMQQIPISPKPRAYSQHPTYVNPTASSAMQPSFSPPQVPKEEVCVECAMRDQDMADVDVTSPGVWERESDILYEELCRREIEEEPSGRASSDAHSRPRAKGGILTEENLRFWQSINPKEPSSRQQTLDQYVKAQRQLLEVEALARARTLRESRLLDEKMRDTFSQLRRSAYELGSSSQPTDDTGALRLKSSGNAQNHAREVTLLENGMVVEHVDLRREEKEERERRRKDEKREKSRARKSSRSSRSVADMASVYSMPLQSPIPQIDSGFFSGARDSRHSQSFSPRPSSVLTGGNERPQTLLRAQSQASFSDMQSVGSASSPRRSRFFGFKNLSAAWLSRDSMAPSGSMMDMHVALQQEQAYFAAHPSALDISSTTPTLRASQSWPRGETSPEPVVSSVPANKKKNGLKKIWKLVTRSSKGAAKGVSQSKSVDRHEDDMPLAPPPPLSYLVDRERGAGRRHVSTPSLLSSMSPNGFSQFAPSPPTAPSSALPSPTSSRYPVLEEKSSGEAHKEQVKQEMEPDHRISAFELGPSNDTGSPDLENRGRTTHSSSKTLSSSGPTTPGTSPPHQRPQSTLLSRDKSLPPIPGEPAVEFPGNTGLDGRPQTMYDLLQNSSNPMSRGLMPPQAPFRTPDTRRQSFGGMASSPHPAVQSLPSRSPYGRGTLNVPPFLAEEKYAEFGASSPSLTQWGTQGGKRAMTTPSKPKKRRSRFGLTSLFGKKSTDTERDSQVFAPSATNGSVNGSTEPADYNPYRSSASDQRDEPSFNGYGGPGSAHSSSAPRMSIISKKNIAELVDQDPEFVAYRYPSSDQRLEVLR